MSDTRPELEAPPNPVISASALLALAKEAENCGAKRYAEAYRLVAVRLLENDDDAL